MMDPGGRQATEPQIKEAESWKVPQRLKKEDVGWEGVSASVTTWPGFGTAQETPAASP